ncbi:Hypothetical protein, predicted transmembrane protein [Metamycoplasma alkalescens 14918]|uniref:Uncharacterized protein n=1 Tax=Metamycoplasma alkalescens 14918 TaxID=1188234 RepID=N9UA60_9BACT|nr:hypothetical protein [Metamycoplasma alkalescens]ENY53616.1 Hypothetical protein, predicted transmembrane protein [Metamycoplasma alkalescens 14918]
MKIAVLSKRGIALKYFLNISFLIIFVLIALATTFLVFWKTKSTSSTKTFLVYLYSNWKTLVISGFIFKIVFNLSWLVTFSFLKNQFFQDSISGIPYPRYYKLFNMFSQDSKIIYTKSSIPFEDTPDATKINNSKKEMSSQQQLEISKSLLDPNLSHNLFDSKLEKPTTTFEVDISIPPIDKEKKLLEYYSYSLDDPTLKNKDTLFISEPNLVKDKT